VNADAPTPWPRLLDVHLAARYLSVGETTVRDWVACGILRNVTMPGSALREPGGRVVAQPQDRRMVKLLLDIQDLDALVDRLKEETC